MCEQFTTFRKFPIIFQHIELFESNRFRKKYFLEKQQTDLETVIPRNAHQEEDGHEEDTEDEFEIRDHFPEPDDFTNPIYY